MQNQVPVSQNRPVTGRFAPSPSGRLHLGNLACSLLAWLSAKSQGGRIVLRIEDLDAERCPRVYADLLEQDLAWLGLTWDEGGSTGGAHAPYYQSECGDIYTQSYRKLEQKGLVYPCFCSRSQLHAASAPHTSDGNVIYPGTCRGLTPEEIAEKRKKKAPAYRLMVPDEAITFTDGCMGIHTENLLRDCGDFYLRRADGVFAYQLAVVVDDARMGVTEVVRGADLLSSTARQLYLYRLLACSRPALPTARCCWQRTGGGCPSGTATRALKTYGQNTPRRRSSASWRMPTACSRSRRPAPRKALCRTLRGRKSPSRISACPRGCFKKGNEKTTPASAKGADGSRFFFLPYALRTCGSWLRSRAVKALSSASASSAPKATSMQLCCLSSTVEQTMETHSTAAAGRIQRRRGASKMRLR